MMLLLQHAEVSQTAAIMNRRCHTNCSAWSTCRTVLAVCVHSVEQRKERYKETDTTAT